MSKRRDGNYNDTEPQVATSAPSHRARKPPQRPGGLSECSTHYLGIDDYQSLIRQSISYVACFDFLQPVPLFLSTNEFVSTLYSVPSVCLEASNALALSLNERTSFDLIGGSLAEILPAARNWAPTFAQWHQGSQGYDALEAELSHQDGSQWTAQVALYPRTIDRHLHRIWIVARDITRQVQALHALSSIESHYQAMLNAPNTLSFRISPEGACSHMSPASIALLGLFQSGGPKLPDIVAAEDVDTLLSIFRHTRPNLFPLSPVTVKFKMRDGSFLPFVVRQHPTWSSHYVMESCDIIASRLALPDSRSHSSSIGQAPEHYRRIAHDLNNFMLVTQAHLHRIREGYSDPEALRLTSEALESCISLTARFFEPGRAVVTQHPSVNAHTELQRIVALLQPMIPSAIQITIKPENPELFVRAGKAIFYQIFSNLIINASEALGTSGSITLSIRPTTALLTQGKGIEDAVCIEVSDNGPGIADSVHSNLFNSHTSTKADGGHHGLGLASVKNSVESLGGSIRVESSPDGALFGVILPLSAAADQDTMETSGAHTVPATGREKLRILVADDEPLIREAIKSILSSMGHSVSVVPDGGAALKCISAEASNVDVILLDDHMPSGRASPIAQQLISTRPNLRVIVTSGDPEVASSLDRCGSQITFLPKPFTPTEFEAALLRAQAPRS
jgi:CheY-like chemotaxis protein/PAS domain-containing protein